MAGGFSRNWLDTIAYAEGTDRPDGYQTTFGYGPKLDLNAGHPDRVQGSGRLKSAAAGRYQHMPETWIGSNGGKNVAMTPANQDASALRLIRQRGVDPEKDPLTPENVAKLAPEWASLPTLAGKSYYGQPVKSFGELQSRWAKTGQSAPGPAPAGGTPSPSAPKPTLAGVQSLETSNPMSAILAAGVGGGVPFAQGDKFAYALGGLTQLITGESDPTPQATATPPQFRGQTASEPPAVPQLASPSGPGLAAVQALLGGTAPAPALPAPSAGPAGDTSFTQPTPAAPTQASPAGKPFSVGRIADPSEDVFPTTGAHLDVRVLKPDGTYANPMEYRSRLSALQVNGKPLFGGADWSPAAPITSGFGPRNAPTAGASTDHKGVDFGIGANTRLEWAGGGEYSFDGGIGRIKTPDGYTFKLLHTRPS